MLKIHNDIEAKLSFTQDTLEKLLFDSEAFRGTEVDGKIKRDTHRRTLRLIDAHVNK